MAYADDAAHHGPQSFWTRYIWSQDHKVIAVQYTLVAIVVGLIVRPAIEARRPLRSARKMS